MRLNEISAQRHAVDGFTLSAIVGGYLVQERFIGYTIREAKRLFIKRQGGRN